MPPQPEIAHDIIDEHLANAEIFDKNGSLKNNKDNVWANLIKSIGLKKMKPKSLHLYAYKKIQIGGCKFMPKTGAKKSMKSKHMKKKTRKNHDPEFTIYDLKNPHKKALLKFPIFFEEKEWMSIKPSLVKKEKKLEKRIWTNMVYRKLFSAQGLRCNYNFKIQSVTGTLDDFEITFKAHCTECKTDLCGELIKIIRDDESIKYGFNITTFAVQKIDHASKRNLAADEREQAQVQLVNKYATEYREDVQKDLMQDRSYEPANLHDSGIYEKARQEARNREIGYDASMTLLSISVIKKANIMKISFSPICIVYCSDKQINFWNKVRDMEVTLSLDATGGLFKSTVFKDLKSHSLLYYAMVVGVENKIVPVMQFITAAHDIPAVTEALSIWVESGARIPKSISSDASLTIQHSATIVFNKLTFTEHNLACYKYLRNMDVELPACLYKSDTPHLLRTLDRWQCFKSKDSTILLFYKRIVAYMTKITAIEEFKKTAMALITVSQSETVPKGSKCEEHLAELENLIKTHNFIQKCVDETAELDTNCDYEISQEPKQSRGKDNILTEFIQKIVTKAEAHSTKHSKLVTHPPNPYCALGFLQNFKPLCEKFPTWTDIMMDAYNLKGEKINSARSETFFRKKKAQIPRPINIIKFLLHDNMKIDSYVSRDYPSIRFRERHEKLSSEPDVFDVALESIFDDENICET